MRLPILEHTELFNRSLGSTSDIVAKEMYTFLDKSSHSLTLRPEGTVGVLRSMLQERIWPQKVYYEGPMFRYERPQRGRYREFQQFGVEYLGAQDPMVDAEVIWMAETVLRALGTNASRQDHLAFVLHLNTLGDEESRHRYKKCLQTYFERYQLDLSSDSQRRLARQNPLRILDSKHEQDQSIIQECPLITEYLTLEAQRVRKKETIDKPRSPNRYCSASRPCWNLCLL